ncbi:transcription factor TFIIIB component B'' homolog [Liolophura sinensis]|uniref:transcription factor TFIIIB component B'' homolog n=1 Tax=Liolophura sinensis TaxID=3198878 RepID=UPI0031590AAF
MMSMRRSRLQVKPNLGSRGGKPPGSRPSKVEDKPCPSVAPQDKPTVSAKDNETALESTGHKVRGNSADNPPAGSIVTQNTQPSPLSRVQQVAVQRGNTLDGERCEAATVPNVAIVTNSGSENIKDSSSKCTSQQSRCEEVELTKIKEKPLDTGQKSSGQVNSLQNKVQSPSPEKTDKEITKPAARLRSRFANRVKPNLSEAGKSRTRRSANKALDTTQTSNQLNVQPVTPLHGSDLTADLSDTPRVAQDEVSESRTATERTTSPQVLCDAVDSCGERVGAEVVIAGEVAEYGNHEVFTPPLPPTHPECPPPSHNARLSTSGSVAESEPSKDEEEVKESPPPAPKHKRRLPRVQAPVDKPPDKFKMLMKDLIYWNPIKNPMKVREKKKAVESGHDVSDALKDGGSQEVMEKDEELPVPQVKIGPDGSIILNEESLVIEKPSDQSEMSDIGVVDETDSLITSSSFRTRHLSKNWTEKETERFYYALSVVGTDFSMMSNLFKRRNRYDLKKKFKREEKYNRSQVDKALKERKKIDMSVFENVSDEGEDKAPRKKAAGKGKGRVKKRTKGQGDEEESSEGKPKKVGRKRKTARRRAHAQHFEESDDSAEKETADQNREPGGAVVLEGPCVPVDLEDDDEDNEEFRTIAKKDAGSSSDEEDTSRVLENMCQTTRSGRVPKRTSFYTAEEQAVAAAARKRQKKDPGVITQADNRTSVSVKSTGSQTPEGRRADPVQIQTVHNIPSVGGSQLVLVTQKGADSAGQGTVIHVYMLSPSSHRSPEWPASPLTSPRTNPHVYSVSPRGSASDGEVSSMLVMPQQESGVVDEEAQPSAEDALPIVCAEETVSTSETVTSLEHAVIEALRE